MMKMNVPPPSTKSPPNPVMSDSNREYAAIRNGGLDVNWDKISKQLSIGLLIVFEAGLGIIWLGWGFDIWIIKAMGITAFMAFGLGYAIGALANLWFTIVSRIPKREVKEIPTIKVVKLTDAERVLLASHVLNTRHFLLGESFNRKASGFPQSTYGHFHRLGITLGIRNGDSYVANLDVTCPLLIKIDEAGTEDEREMLYDQLWSFVEAQWRVSGVSQKDQKNLWITNPETKSKTVFPLEKV